MSKVIFSIVLIICCLCGLHGQDPVLSQFYSQPLELNPALTGNLGGTRIGVNYRNQWLGLSSNYVTYGVNADHFIKDLNSGFGISLLTDDAGSGILKTTNAALSYSYRLEFGKESFIRLGLQVGIINVNLAWDKLIFGDGIDPIEGPISPGGTRYPSAELLPDFNNFTRLDVGFGAFMNNENFYVGLGLKHLNRPNLTFYEANENTKKGLPIRLSAMSGYRIPIGDYPYGRQPTLSLMPNILVVSQGRQGQVNLGSLLYFKTFSFGLYYRHAFTNPDALIGTVGYDFEGLHLGYSYDFTISQLGVNTGGTHEISLSYFFNTNKDSKYSDCSKMFR